MSVKFLYVHGFNSSGDTSDKVEKLRREFGDDNVLSPTLSYIPDVAVKELDDIILSLKSTGFSNDKIVLIGTSLGGYYSLYFSAKYNIPAVLLNPSIKPYETLLCKVGKNVNYKTGLEYEFTEQHLDSLEKYHVPKETLSLLDLSVYLDSADEVIDSNKSFDYFYRSGVSYLDMIQGGSHRFDHIENVIDDINNRYRINIKTGLNNTCICEDVTSSLFFIVNDAEEKINEVRKLTNKIPDAIEEIKDIYRNNLMPKNNIPQGQYNVLQDKLKQVHNKDAELQDIYDALLKKLNEIGIIEEQIKNDFIEYYGFDINKPINEKPVYI